MRRVIADFSSHFHPSYQAAATSLLACLRFPMLLVWVSNYFQFNLTIPFRTIYIVSDLIVVPFPLLVFFFFLLMLDIITYTRFFIYIPSWCRLMPSQIHPTFYTHHESSWMSLNRKKRSEILRIYCSVMKCSCNSVRTERKSHTGSRYTCEVATGWIYYIDAVVYL